MKLSATITALLLAPFLYAQTGEASGGRTEYEPYNTHKRKIHSFNAEFDRIDYIYQGNLLLSALQHNGGGGYPRTWRYYYEQEKTNKVVNLLKARYPNKQLYGAVEVAFRNTLVYEVVMQDKKRWYVYRVDTLGAVHLKKRFRKI